MAAVMAAVKAKLPFATESVVGGRRAAKYRRMPLEVVTKCETSGKMVPVMVTWHDGRSFAVDRVWHVKKMRCEKTFGPDATRYECVIAGHHRALYRGDDGVWFVEVPNGRTEEERLALDAAERVARSRVRLGQQPRRGYTVVPA